MLQTSIEQMLAWLPRQLQMATLLVLLHHMLWHDNTKEQLKLN